MPATRLVKSPARVLGIALGLACAAGAWAQTPAAPSPPDPASAPAKPEVETSALDAQLFYELLIGEIELQSGDKVAAYQLLLDAARRAKDDQLFRRATDVALQARAGDQALATVVAWREALPDSQDALRYQVQLLVALNRVNEAEEPISALLRSAPRPSLPAMIDAVPRFLGRSPDRSATALLVERVLAPYRDAAETRTSAGVATSRAFLAAGDNARALDFDDRAGAADPAAEAPALLALEMLPTTPAAEAIVKRHLDARPGSVATRLLYVRTLATSQRFDDAAAQLEVLTRSEPNLAPPWLTLGALELELKRPKEATAALEKYVRLVEGGASVTMSATPAVPSAPVVTINGSTDDDDDGNDAPTGTAGALTQAWLLLAQAAEQQKDFPAAERYLSRIDNPQRALDVQTQRASLLARQGKVTEARELIRRVPEQTANDARAKLLAEASLLRDRKLWTDAVQVLAQANKTFPEDTDLLYEQAMVDEKLDRLDEMERLLRRVIELKPDHHQAYNALGYSLAERKIRLPEARTLIAKALELSPGEPFITDSLGWVEYRMGNRDEAIRLLRGAYQARPDPEIAAHLGEVLWSAGQNEEARRVFREGRSRDSSNDVLRETLARLRVDL